MLQVGSNKRVRNHLWVVSCGVLQCNYQMLDEKQLEEPFVTGIWLCGWAKVVTWIFAMTFMGYLNNDVQFLQNNFDVFATYP